MNLIFDFFQNQILFDGEVALNYLDIKNYIISNTLPIIGPPTGHSWIDLGPLFYWIMMPIFKIFGFWPIIPYFLFVILFFISAYLCYRVTKNIFDKNIALIATIIFLFSEFWITLFNYARFYLFAVPLTFIFIDYFIKAIKGQRRSLFISFFLLGVIINFHLSVLVLIFASIVSIYFLNKKLINFSNIIYSLFFFSLPNIPFIIVNIQKNFEPIIKLLIWIPYRFIRLIL